MRFINSTRSLPWHRALALALAFAAVLGTLAPSLRAGEIKGVLLPERVARGECRLDLNGTAVRSKWGFGVYVVALYLSEENRDADSILLNRDPKRIHITMLRGVSEERFVATILKNIAVNFSDEEQLLFASEITSFLHCFGGGLALHKSSTVNIDFLPGEGMLVSMNGHEFEMIPGDDFYHAVLRLWIGQPPQLSVKKGLVGSAE